MKPFRWLHREPLRGGAFPHPTPAGHCHSRRAPFVIFPIFLLMLAVAAVAPAWATPDQSPHNQTIPTPTPAPTATPTSGPCGPTEVLSSIIDTDTI
jgi:hypothetical protein